VPDKCLKQFGVKLFEVFVVYRMSEKIEHTGLGDNPVDFGATPSLMLPIWRKNVE